MSNGMKKSPLHLVEEELAKLRVQAAPFEAQGQYDTAHHKMIRRLELVLLETELVSAKPESEEEE